MDDNARLHRSRTLEELLESEEDISRMDWSAYSPDLNPREHVWDAFGGDGFRFDYIRRKSIQQLKGMLNEEWAFLPQQLMDNLMLSLNRRCQRTIVVKTDHILYLGTFSCFPPFWADN
ncbi:hypothetical protein AVEN_152581-1 [Araneus ventricosus]|uniref:Uncharacterized protein n=1 Tax=Araneus ventricosus TaxID=182803 RepID=A0A4Y2FWN3_ARAVE|nr:hypothetical protein AVEN_152581-1 [Araneus ventricosus]